MRRDRASKRGRWLSLLIAALVGYLLGDWHAAAVRLVDLSPTQNVAMRFPEATADTAVADAAAEAQTGAPGAMVLGNTPLALLSPDPMVLPRAGQSAPQAPVSATAPQPAAPLPATAAARRVMPAAMPPRAEAKPMEAKTMAAQPRLDLKSAALADAARHANRPGFVLNDAQIASIKSRLHLSPDQEQMWPAVEAALRNIAYAKAQDARRRSAPGSTSVATLDPDSAEVQGLKSAAVPLIMSFSDEQKNEVRSLAHVMGLDKLAAEF
jgi:hypothetical protein